MSDKLDRKQKYAMVRGHPKARFLQDGKLYGFQGNFIEDVDPAYVPDDTDVKPIKPAEQVRAEALRRQTLRLKKVGDVPSLPQSVVNVQKEREAIAQAESKAE